MKKFILLNVLLVFSFTSGAAQKVIRNAPANDEKSSSVATVSEFSEDEWNKLAVALRTENWNSAATLAARYLEKLKIENEKKQLAQLRYFYLYALAGKILNASTVKAPIDVDQMWKELDAAVGNFSGKEFVLPPRRAMFECREVLNYICRVKDDERTLRVTATNSEGTMIHSFEYFVFDDKINFDQLGGKEIFLGGRLKRAEFNQDTANLWVMRLVFEKSFARVVMTDEK